MVQMTVRFTSVSLFLFAAGCAFGNDTLLCISKGTLWGTAVSFSVAPCFDSTAYSRLREKNGWSLFQFWAGNVVLHFLPLYAVRNVHPHPVHSTVSALLHFWWAMVESAGTWSLSHVYVPLPTRTWVKLLCIAFFVEINTWSWEAKSLASTIEEGRNPLSLPAG